MPSGPLYYGPLVDAYAKSVPIRQAVPPKEPGGQPVVVPVAASDLAEHQINFSIAAAEPGAEKKVAALTKGAQGIIDSEQGAKAVLGTLDGLDRLHSSRKGAAPIQLVKLAVDDSGYVANRTVTLVDNHPESLEYTNLDQAVEQGGKFAERAQAELRSGSHARFSRNALDLGPQLTAVLGKSWSGKEVSAREAVQFGMHVSREMERAVTPLPPEGSHKAIQWIEDATIDLLSVWPGRIPAVVNAAGLRVAGDPKDLAKLEGEARMAVLGGPNVEANRTLGGVLTLAGIDPGDQTQRAQAAALLQDVSLDEVPMSLAKGIIAARKLPEDKAEWLAGRIVDLGGRPGNVGGLAAELAGMLPPPKA